MVGYCVFEVPAELSQFILIEVRRSPDLYKSQVAFTPVVNTIALKFSASRIGHINVKIPIPVRSWKSSTFEFG